jgi:hypothetical protein
MTESKAFETTMNNFLLGLSMGVLLATIFRRRSDPKSIREAVDIGSKESFLASDSPAH